MLPDFISKALGHLWDKQPLSSTKAWLARFGVEFFLVSRSLSPRIPPESVLKPFAELLDLFSLLVTLSVAVSENTLQEFQHNLAYALSAICLVFVYSFRARPFDNNRIVGVVDNNTINTTS